LSGKRAEEATGISFLVKSDMTGGAKSSLLLPQFGSVFSQALLGRREIWIEIERLSESGSRALVLAE